MKKFKPDKQSLVYKLFSKHYKYLTKEERLEYHRVINKRNYKPRPKINDRPLRTNTMVYRMFGKKLKELTIEERRVYLQECQHLAKKRAFKKEMKEIYVDYE